MMAALRAYPTLLRVGLMDMVAYRAEFLIWALTTNMPLVMLAVWHTVTADAPVGRWGQPQFVAYYLLTMVVRLITSNWVMWEITMEIRQGTLGMRLLRPIHPVLHYSAEQLAAVPMRLVFVTPVLVVLVFVAGGQLSVDPAIILMGLLAVVGAWLLQFFLMVVLGMCTFYVESAFGLFEVWMAVHAILGGYLVPLELYPPWLRAVTDVLPFRAMLAFPVEVFMGLHDRAAVLSQLGLQWGYVVLFAVLGHLMWKAGLRRFAAFGG